MDSKSKSRAKLRAARRTLSEHHVNFFSQQICENIMALAAYQNAQHIGCYLATNHEANLEWLIKSAWQQGKDIYLPVVVNTTLRIMQFYPYTKNSTLIAGAHNIKEPDIKNLKPIEPHSLELIITPLVGFDKQCHRLGQGHGFYDRYLSHYSKNKNSVCVLGAGYEVQLLANTPIDPWDVPLDGVVSEKTIYYPI